MNAVFEEVIEMDGEGAHEKSERVGELRTRIRELVEQLSVVDETLGKM